jgi:hypothetical protein
MQPQLALRPASRAVYQHLVGLAERARGLLLAEIAASMSLSERTVRRAARELELAELASFARNSSHEKVVSDVTIGREASARIREQNGPKRPKTAQVKTAQNGPKRPNRVAPLSLLVNSNSIAVAAEKTRAPARPPAEFEQQQQRQQLLGLEVSDDRDLGAARAMLERLDAAVRSVWDRVGRRHGWLAVDEPTLAGLALAMRRYPLAELEACVVWSAERLAAGRLSPGYFATTFRGNAFAARHRDWQNELAAEDRRRRQEAAIAADVRTAPVEQLELAGGDRRPPDELRGDELERLGREALQRFAALGGT